MIRTQESSGTGSTPRAGAGRVSPHSEIASGTVVGTYRVLSELGRGGMGVVYRAEDLRRGGTVALKTLLWGDPGAVLRFKQEFRAIADITHPNLATLYELVSEDGRLFFTMELVEGVDFSAWVQADPARLRPALSQLAQGLRALHAAGCIHRDLKPPNVLVARNGRVVILDFGLAATMDSEGAHQSTQRHALGTPAYMAPEQALGKAVTPSCDWYSVGVMLYEAVTGRVPFDGSGLEVMVEKQRRTPRPPSELAQGIAADLDALCTALLHREPAERPSGDDVLRRLQAEGPAGEPKARTPTEGGSFIVGRESHLEALHDAFEELKERRPVIVLVHGNSGMGKSTIVEAFQEAVRRTRDVVVLRGKCYERESVPYKALDSPIDALARHLGRLPRAEAEALLPRDVHSIARVFPVLRKVEAIAQAPPPLIEISDPQELRRRAFAGIREVFARISDRVPLVLCVDDLQWGDADSADLLTSLLRPPEAPPFLFVGCYRREDQAGSPFLDSFRQPGRDLPEPREIRVDPLSEVEATSLLTGVGVPAARATTLARESGGSPFFLHELAAHGHSVSDAGGVTLEGVLRQRIKSLPPGAKALIEVVAVAGRPVPLATVVFAARLEAGAQSAMMAALRGTRLVRGMSSARGEVLDAYHDRVRETVVAGIPEERLRELHRRLGLALEADRDVDPEVLGLHFEGAGDAARAGRHYAGGADDAHQALAFDHAVRLYGKALELLAPTGAERRDLLRRLADALADAGRGGEAGHVYLEAAEGAERAESLELRSRAAHQFLVTGHLAEWRTVIDPVQQELGIRLARSPLLAFLRSVRDIVWIRVRGFRYRERDPAAVPREAILRLETCYSLATGLSQTSILEGLQYHTLSVRLALRLGHPLYVALGASRHIPYESLTALTSDRRAEQLRRHATHLAEEVGAPVADAYLQLAVGMYSFLKGRWRAARGPLGRAATRFREECPGSWWERDTAVFWRLMCFDFQGELREVVSQGSLHMRDAEDRGSLYMETDLRTRVIYLGHLLRDAPEEAQAGLDRAIAKWPRDSWSLQHYRWTESSIAVALYHGDAASAAKVIDQAWPVFRRSFMTQLPLLWNVLFVMRQRLTLLEAAQRSARGAARKLLSRSASACRRLAAAREPYASGWGELLRAGAANVSLDTEAAIRHLVAAESKFAEAEMAAYLAVTKRRRGQLIGGDEGRELVAEGDAWLRGQGVQDPVAWSRMYAPGFED